MIERREIIDNFIEIVTLSPWANQINARAFVQLLNKLAEKKTFINTQSLLTDIT